MLLPGSGEDEYMLPARVAFYATALVDQSDFILYGSKSKLPSLFPCFAILHFSDIAYYGFVFTDSDVIVIKEDKDLLQLHCKEVNHLTLHKPFWTGFDYIYM